MRDTLALALVRAELCRTEMRARRTQAQSSRHAGLRGIIGRTFGSLRRMRRDLFVIRHGMQRRRVLAHETSSPPD